MIQMLTLIVLNIYQYNQQYTMLNKIKNCYNPIPKSAKMWIFAKTKTMMAWFLCHITLDSWVHRDLINWYHHVPFPSIWGFNVWIPIAQFFIKITTKCINFKPNLHCFPFSNVRIQYLAWSTENKNVWCQSNVMMIWMSRKHHFPIAKFIKRISTSIVHYLATLRLQIQFHDVIVRWKLCILEVSNIYQRLIILWNWRLL